jgi:peptidyl-prolyl cis-trans isomerase SurA
MSKHEKGSNNKMDLLWSSKGVSDLPNENNTYKFIIVDGVVGPEPKTLKEAKGMVTSDYQNHLEKEWLKEMRSKYPVSLNQKAIDNLFK